jgi:hypothetical protein
MVDTRPGSLFMEGVKQESVPISEQPGLSVRRPTRET